MKTVLLPELLPGELRVTDSWCNHQGGHVSTTAAHFASIATRTGTRL